MFSAISSCLNWACCCCRRASKEDLDLEALTSKIKILEAIRDLKWEKKEKIKEMKRLENKIKALDKNIATLKGSVDTKITKKVQAIIDTAWKGNSSPRGESNSILPPRFCQTRSSPLPPLSPLAEQLSAAIKKRKFINGSQGVIRPEWISHKRNAIDNAIKEVADLGRYTESQINAAYNSLPLSLGR